MKLGNKKRQLLGLIGLISFITNLIWESLQPSLFENYPGFWQHFWQCALASIGDMIFTTGLYLLLVYLFKDFFWIGKLTVGKALIVILAGALSAVIFEKIAVSLSMWEYGDMPIIPLLNVGS